MRFIDLILPVATHCYVRYHLHPFPVVQEPLVAKQHPTNEYTVCFPLYAVVNHTPASVMQRATMQAEKSSPQDCETTPPIRSTECRSPVRKATAKEKKTGTKTMVSASTTATKCTCTFSDGYTIEHNLYHITSLSKYFIG